MQSGTSVPVHWVIPIRQVPKVWIDGFAENGITKKGKLMDYISRSRDLLENENGNGRMNCGKIFPKRELFDGLCKRVM